ncbi:polysaccharide biosynthesis/export family protein [Abyssalbus ytuae]|uniref:Polysaccharide export protein n=1 Tax=Abyssalbus ytuae TaxID=2926907 RepID=A0A9E6ZMP8_9FLAO|nr:polysaccharide biosynthesis/export family protein [Abyssalbus ytuae]UOB17085.1 polysaccharide export protein [Abyssalbus ytuae]
MNKPFFFKNSTKLFFISLFLSVVNFSCESTKNIVYFQNANNAEVDAEVNTFEQRFKEGDILSIHVSTFDMAAAAPFNLNGGSGLENESNSGSNDITYYIGKDGNIDFPVLGKIKLAGLTNKQARQLLVSKLKEYLKDPIVNIKIKNFRITVLGAVNNPGTYNVKGDHITLLEALGLAGDLHIKGLRENILVIRELNGSRTYTRVDITNKQITHSPVYYLTQNDIIYVEPNKSARTSATLDNRVTVAISILSILITTGVVLLTR